MHRVLGLVNISNNVGAASGTNKDRLAGTRECEGQLPSRWRIATRGRASRVNVGARVIPRIPRSGAARVTIGRAQDASGLWREEVTIFVHVGMPPRFVGMVGISNLTTRRRRCVCKRTVASAQTVLGWAGGMSCGHAEGAERQGEREEGLGGEPIIPQCRLGLTEQVGQCRSASDLGPGRHSSS